MKLSFKEGRQGKIHIYVDDVYTLTVEDTFWFSEKGHKKKGPFSPFGKRPLCHILYPVFTSSNHPQLPQRTDAVFVTWQ